MNVVIVGGGKVGSYLASLLLEGEHDVHIVENRPHVLARLHRELPTEVIVDGDGTRRETLDLAHADRADVLVTATGDDEVNLTIALMAKTFYKIPRVIGRINNPRNAWLFTPEMGVDVAVNQTDLLSKLILEEMSLGDMMILLRLRKGDARIGRVQPHQHVAALHRLGVADQHLRHLRGNQRRHLRHFGIHIGIVGADMITPDQQIPGRPQQAQHHDCQRKTGQPQLAHSGTIRLFRVIRRSGIRSL